MKFIFGIFLLASVFLVASFVVITFLGEKPKIEGTITGPVKSCENVLLKTHYVDIKLENSDKTFRVVAPERLMSSIAEACRKGVEVKIAYGKFHGPELGRNLVEVNSITTKSEVLLSFQKRKEAYQDGQQAWRFTLLISLLLVVLTGGPYFLWPKNTPPLKDELTF